MDAKEAIEIVKENIQQIKELQNNFTGAMDMLCQRDIDGLLMAISALEKVPTLEAENARLRELAFNHCSLHGKAFGNTPNYQKMFCNGKCEGYCRGADDDEPIDECKECIINEFYEE